MCTSKITQFTWRQAYASWVVEGRHDVEHGPKRFLLCQFSGWMGLIVGLQGCLQFLWDDSLLIHRNWLKKQTKKENKKKTKKKHTHSYSRR